MNIFSIYSQRHFIGNCIDNKCNCAHFRLKETLATAVGSSMSRKQQVSVKSRLSCGLLKGNRILADCLPFAKTGKHLFCPSFPVHSPSELVTVAFLMSTRIVLDSRHWAVLLVTQAADDASLMWWGRVVCLN